MDYNVEYHTKDKSLGHVMAITVDTTLKQIINFIGDYEKFSSMFHTYDLVELFSKNNVVYVYLNKVIGHYFFITDLDLLPEIEGEQK